jgi:hypothetical protein
MSGIAKYKEVQEKFELVCSNAEGLSIAQNAGAAFDAVVIVKTLRELLTDEIMKDVFMPLMNTKIGFATDRNGKPDKRGNTKPLYSINIVRDAIIDAAAFGLLPTFNQMNIISEKMYPTKEGFTALLKKIKAKYIFSFGQDTSPDTAKFAEISVKINYEYRGEKSSFLMTAVVPKTSYSSYDQLKGKAERRGKKMLYEYLTGLDLGENDGETIQSIEESTKVEDAEIIDQKAPEIKKVKL